LEHESYSYRPSFFEEKWVSVFLSERQGMAESPQREIH
jgi:hypothetical protein